MCYVGPWEDPDGGLKRYQEQWDDLHAGRTPRVQADGFASGNAPSRYTVNISATAIRHPGTAGSASATSPRR